MSYTKTTWSDGDIITANKMNNIETGVESLNTDVGQLQTDLDNLTGTVENLPTGGDYQELVDDVSQVKADLSESVGDLKSALGTVRNAIAENITFVDASYVKWADGSIGSNYGSAKASDYVAVTSGRMFNLCNYVASESITNTIGMAFYDEDKRYLSGVAYTGADLNVVIPAGAFYVRFTVYVSRIDSYMVSVGNLSSQHDFSVLREYDFPISEKIIGLNNISAVPMYAFENEITFETGKYVNNQGQIKSASYASLSDFINAENLKVVYAFLTNAMPIALYDANKVWFRNIYDLNNTYTSGKSRLYALQLPQKCKYIRICNVHTMLEDAKTYVGYGNGLERQTNTAPSVTKGKYVSVISNGEERSVSYAEVTEYIEVSAIESYYTALSSVLSVCYYDIDKQYISGVYGTDAEAPSWRTLDAPANAVYVRISNDSRQNPDSVFIKINVIDKINASASKADIRVVYNRIDSLDIPRNMLDMYDNINCIGDSLTWSQVYVSNTSHRRAYKTYPQVLASLCNAESHTYATPGDSATLWWERSSEGAFDHHGLYIIFLGTNDGLTDTISTDCIGTDPDSFANTQTGQYGRILQTIANNGDKAVLILPYGGGGNSLAVTRDVIAQFGAKYAFPVINLDSADRTNAYYHYYPDQSGQNILHFNDLGYAWMANEICQQINKLSPEDQWKIIRTQ